MLASLSWKRLQIGMGMLSITTSTSDELFSCINIDDFERPWTTKIRGFYWFLRSSAAAHTKNELRQNGWRDWQFANRNCYRFSRVSWALAQLSCFFVASYYEYELSRYKFEITKIEIDLFREIFCPTEVQLEYKYCRPQVRHDWIIFSLTFITANRKKKLCSCLTIQKGRALAPTLWPPSDPLLFSLVYLQERCKLP